MGMGQALTPAAVLPLLTQCPPYPPSAWGWKSWGKVSRPGPSSHSPSPAPSQRQGSLPAPTPAGREGRAGVLSFLQGPCPSLPPGLLEVGVQLEMSGCDEGPDREKGGR